MLMTDTDTTLVMTQSFPVPPEAVFDAWTVQEQFAAWIGPVGFQCEVPQFEARVGGAYRIMMRMSTGNIMPASGVFKVMDRPDKLVLTWGWNDDPARQSLITMTFAPKAGGTEMTFRQEGLGTVENRDAHFGGWTSAFGKLGAFLAG